MFKSSTILPPKITWPEMVAKEPKLNDLLIQASQMQPDPHGYFCQADAMHTGWKGQQPLKRQLSKLVGHFSAHVGTPLGTSEAWDVAMKTIPKALPPCCITPA